MTDTASKTGVAARPLIAAKERGPGPGRYGLPSTLGSKTHDATKHMEPAFSFGQKLPNSIFKKTDSPGPGYYVNPKMSRYGSDGTPSFSMSGRTKDFKPAETPAPGAYRPEGVHPQKEVRAPVYSMGARTMLRTNDVTPAPTSYNLNNTVGAKVATVTSAPAHSISGRTTKGGFADDLAKTPGPGKYNVTSEPVKSRPPAYSLQGRTYVPADNTKKPGPGSHSPEKVNFNKHLSPSYSMGVKHSDYITPLIVDVPE